MSSIFNWTDFDNTRIIIQAIFIAISVGLYGWIITLDFKHKEMELWKVLLSCSVNLILPIISVIIWGCDCLIIPIIVATIIWVILFFINTKFNKENFIGQADVDIFLVQLCILGAISAWIFIKAESKVKLLVFLLLLQTEFGALFIGLLFIVIIWSIKLIINKIKFKDKKIKDIIKENKNVPAIISLLPMIFTNLYMIMSI